MRWDRLTVMSQEALQRAQAKAEELGNPEVRPEHLLWSFLGQEENVVSAVLAKVGAPTARIRGELEAALARLPKVGGGGEPVLSPSLRDIMAAAEKAAEALKDEYVSTEHLFLAMLRDGGSEAGRSSARTASPRTPSSRPWPPCAAPSASPTRSPRANTRSSTSIPAT